MNRPVVKVPKCDTKRLVSGAMLAFIKPDCINTHISASLLVNIGSLVGNYSFVVIIYS